MCCAFSCVTLHQIDENDCISINTDGQKWKKFGSFCSMFCVNVSGKNFDYIFFLNMRVAIIYPYFNL